MAPRRRGIPNKIVSVIKSTYNGAKCRGSEVRQGCILSAVLLLEVIGEIIRASIAKHHSVSKYFGIRWKRDSFLQQLDYADDICLLSHCVLDAANMLYSFENEAASCGLKINSEKTNSMSIENSSTTRQPRRNAIVLTGHLVEVEDI